MALTLFTLIIQLNLLIALMNDSFEKIKENETIEYLLQRGIFIVNLEFWNVGRNAAKHPT